MLFANYPRTPRELAQELLDIQLGSVEDTIALLDSGYPLTEDEREAVIKEIRDLDTIIRREKLQDADDDLCGYAR